MPAQREDKKGSQLQRGSACLSCRRRKIRCNGDRPHCAPCLEHQRLHECIYDDQRKKSRTQRLREKVAALQAKLAELEANNPNYLETVSSEHSSDVDPWSPLAAESALEGASPVALDWPPPETQILEVSSPLHWPDPTASNHWVMGGVSDDSISDMSPLRQTTPVSNVNISVETQQYLLNVFIEHRAQCHFYSNMERFQLSLLQQLGEQPHPALLQAINLMGCYFSRDPQYRKFEADLLQQSLHEITVSLRYCSNLCDVVQASSLLALYCYFNGRFVEGYRHSFVAARLAVALDLHQIPYPSPVYIEDYKTYYDRVAAFWQVYMVDRAWSGVHGILAALSEDEYRGQITTPMMWTSDPAQMMDPLLLPSYLGHLLDFTNIVAPCTDSLSLPALKALSSAIFDRTFHPVTGSENQKDAITHPSVIVAIQRALAVLPPFVGREAWLTQAPRVNAELLVVHTMLQVVELKVCEEGLDRAEGDVRMLWAVDWLSRSIEQLDEDDYGFLDPLIAGVWNRGAKLLIQKARQMKGLINAPGPMFTAGAGIPDIPNIVAFIDHCLDALCRGLRLLGTHTRVAADYVESLEQDYLPLQRTISSNTIALSH